MKLLPEEVNHFYKLLFNVQYYVLLNSEDNKEVKSKEDYKVLSINKKMKYRDILWSNDKWINEYVNINPDNLEKDDIEIIERWKNRIKDRFLIERILKKYSIFISSNSKVYGVIGITDEIADIFPPERIPLYVETILLPYKEKIIYDGLFSTYSISFGRGIRDMFRETYNKAKAENKIILTMS